MRRVLLLVASLLIASQSVAAPPPLDRILAVVDRDIITLSEVRARARPHLRQLKDRPGKAPDQAAIDALYAEMLQKIIDERLIANDAEARHLSTTPDEIEKALTHLSEANKITIEQLFAEVERLGMTRAEYREDIRRQLLEGRWMIVVVRSALSANKTDEKAYNKALEEGRAKELEHLRATHYIEVRK